MKNNDTSAGLILVGAGHAQLAVLERLSRKPLSVPVKLINASDTALYSGMIPGLIAGRYSVQDCSIDLVPLCRRAKVDLIIEEVAAIDANQQRIITNNQMIEYDVLSVNAGSSPGHHHIEGAEQFSLAVKPFRQFIQQIEQFEQSRQQRHHQRVMIIGGGAASVEVLLALHQRWQHWQNMEYRLISASTILRNYPQKVQQAVLNNLQRKTIEVIQETTVTAVSLNSAVCQNGQHFPFDLAIRSTSASSPDWAKKSGLHCDKQGFIAVNESLQSLSHANVFAAGDIAALPEPIPKNGVYAVRAGPVLAKNVLAYCQNQPLTPFRPQRQALSIIDFADGRALANRGNWCAEGRLMAYWKRQLDQQFIKRFK